MFINLLWLFYKLQFKQIKQTLHTHLQELFEENLKYRTQSQLYVIEYNETLRELNKLYSRFFRFGKNPSIEPFTEDEFNNLTQISIELNYIIEELEGIKLSFSHERFKKLSELNFLVDKPHKANKYLIERKEIIKKLLSQIFGSYVGKSVDKISKCNEIISRTPKEIAFWSVYKPWINFINYEVNRIESIAYRQSDNYLNINQVFCERLLNEWDKKENEFSVFILFNLFQLNKLDNLKNLFYYNDNKADLKKSYDPSESIMKEWKENNIRNSVNIKKFNPNKIDDNIEMC